MNSQQLLDFIISPSLSYMGGNYDTKSARMLLLATAAIESNCGDKIKQDGGPARGIWQMEPKTLHDIYDECDAINHTGAPQLLKLDSVDIFCISQDLEISLMLAPVFACMMARHKYAMDDKRLPEYSDMRAIYDYYKRVYNTPGGASTWIKFVEAWKHNGLDDIVL